MKIFFYLGIIGMILFEIASVYFIMPMPGSQEACTIGLAYFLHSNSFLIRGGFLLCIFLGIRAAWRGSWIPVLISIVLVSVVIYMTNFRMAADHMFYQPEHLSFASAMGNAVDSNKIILGVSYNDMAKAYPIQFLGFHHQVRDTIAGKPIMVTYCTVCRTGRVFEPIIDDKTETFRLVGMDHFNAMFEDNTTHSWWRQENGEAVAGPLKGQFLPEFPSTQTSLLTWLSLHPNSMIMQPDPTFQTEYDSLANYEAGRRTGRLTRRDTASWQNKSWIAGITLNGQSKAYDWILLQNVHLLHDVLSGQPILIVLASDQKSILAFQRDNVNQQFDFKNDTLISNNVHYALSGFAANDSIQPLQPVQIYQEYWHSWKTFHPATLQYEEPK